MQTLLVDPPDANVSKLEVGSLIAGRYKIQRVIGKGGYGAVFEALHTGTGQGVAVKTLAPGLEADETALRRFFQEARVTSGLRHPNTIRVFDFGQDDNGLIYLAMELLTGVTLKQELKKRQRENKVFTEREAIEIGVAITKSLGEAHAAGLVHRDLKPDNVFLHQVEGDDPVVKVLDFGIVKLANSSLTLGSDSGIPGTPAFMSPEQVVKRGEIDGRSDLYSLGVVLYNLVTGTVPYKGNDVMQTLYMHIHDPIPDPRKFARTPISDAFAQLISDAMSKDPAHRPDDARQMRQRLVACAGDALSAMSSTISDTIHFQAQTDDPTVNTNPSHRSLGSIAPFSGEVDGLEPTLKQRSEPLVEAAPPRTTALLWALLALVMMVIGVLGTFVYMRATETTVVVEAPPAADLMPEPKPVDEKIEAKVEEKIEPVVEAEPTPLPVLEAKPIEKETKPIKRRRRPAKKVIQDDESNEVLDEKI